MRHIGVVLLAAISIAGSQRLAAQKCGELQPTLRDYWIQAYGESYVNGNGLIPEPSDSEACENIRYDLKTHYACWSDARKLSKPSGYRQILQRSDTGMPRIVQQAIKYRDRGTDADIRAERERAVRDARKLYSDTLAKKKRGEAGMAQAKVAYLAVYSRLAENDCDRGIFVGRDPIIDK